MLPSGLTFWTERTKSAPPTLTTMGWAENTMGLSWAGSSPTTRAYSSAAGKPSISVAMRRSGWAPVTTRRREAQTKCWVLKVMTRHGVEATSSKAASLWKRPS